MFDIESFFQWAGVELTDHAREILLNVPGSIDTLFRYLCARPYTISERLKLSKYDYDALVRCYRFLFPIEMEMDAINEYLCPFGVQLNQQQKDYVISINKFYYDFFLAVELRRTQHLLEYGLTKSQVILIVSYDHYIEENVGG